MPFLLLPLLALLLRTAFDQELLLSLPLAMLSPLSLMYATPASGAFGFASSFPEKKT